MNVILFDDNFKENLLPFTYTRPQADIRVGILTLREKWEKRLQTKTSSITEDYLSEKFPLYLEKQNLLIAGSVCPTDDLVEAVTQLKTGQSLFKNGIPIAHVVSSLPDSLLTYSGEKIEYRGDCRFITQLYRIFTDNKEELLIDFDLITKNRKSQTLGSSNRVIGDKANIFIEEEAIVEAAIFNTDNSKIYIGKQAEIMEGSIIRGDFALCEHAQLKLGAKIYGPTTIGPYCKVGGEINNVVMFGYSNKAHDGFMGNSVIGEWCNIGADTNTSNLKNDYSEVKLWNYAEQRFVKTGLQFCGLIMGDHVKCGINTMFNTGTVVGVASNVFGAGYMPNFIASFRRGGAEKMQDAQIDKVISIAEKAFGRRNKKWDDIEKNILKSIFYQAKNGKEPNFPSLIM